MIRRKWTGREFALGTVFVLVILGLLTFYIWYQTEAIRLGRDSARLEDEISELKEEIKKLEIQKARLLSPERIDKIARERLGLRPPDSGEIIFEDPVSRSKRPLP